MADLTLRGVVKRYGTVEAVRPLDLDIAHNEFVVFVGPSGCGKSTTLRMIAGLEEISEGEIRIGDRVVNHLPPRERNISMVFQNYALYPHMDVAQNQGFGLRMAGRPRAEIRDKVGRAAGMLGLDRLMQRRPAELSGGQRQRVAMGRAIVREPAVFLFDEPLSNLDAKLRGQMRTEIKKLHGKVESTIVYVTHDQVEAMTLADRIVVMREGVVEQVGTPDQVYRTPATRFVAGFLGSPPMNLLRGRIAAQEGGAGPAVALGNGFALPLEARRFAPLEAGRAVTLGIRPDALAPAGSAPHMHRPFALTADLELVEPLGGEALLVVSLGGDEAIARVFRPRTAFVPGRGLAFEIDLEEIHLFDAETGARLNRDLPES